MNKKAGFACTGLFLVLGLGLNAQSKKFEISGHVKDSLQSPMGFATVGLYKSGQLEQALKTTFTNDKGKFLLTTLDTGTFVLIISHTGFQDHKQDIVMKGDPVDAGTITLYKTGTNLAGVTVTARKPLVEQTDDKIIYNVENDPAAKTENAIDILRKTPFVSVDGDNNIQVNGQSNFKVLLNGRETAMFATNIKEALKGFPGALIIKIEVITTPGAKYDAEGVGGIINIITKKKVAGYNGSISTYISNTRWFNGNTNFSAKFGKVGITLNYGAGGTTGMRGTSTSETIPVGNAFYTRRFLAGDRHWKNFWNFGNAEISYEFDTLNTVSAYGNISGGYNRSVLNQTITTSFETSADLVSYYDLSSRNEYPTRSVGTDYIRKFAKNKEREFSLRLNAEFGTSNTYLNSEQDNPDTDRFIINNSEALNRQYTVQADYIHPLTKGRKIEAGAKAILRRATSDFTSMLKYNPKDEYQQNDDNTDYFEYHQDVYSVYATYSFKVKKTTFRLGTRLESTTVDGDFTSSLTKVEQQYINVLPNIMATTKLNNSYTLVFTYGTRIQRPFIWNLNPFVNNNDSMNISYGNPDLDPQTIHSLSSQVRITKGPHFAGLTLTGSYSDNMIVQYATFNKSTGVTSTTSANLGEDIQLSLNTNITAKMNADWTITLNGNLRYNRVRNNTENTQVNSGYGGNANLNSNYLITKRWNVTAYAGFWRAPVSIQFSYPLNHWYGLGMGYKFFKEKLNVSMLASNFLVKTWDYKMKIRDPAFNTTNINTFPFRGIALNCTYTFGKLKENVSKKKGVTNDDLIQSSSN